MSNPVHPAAASPEHGAEDDVVSPKNHKSVSAPTSNGVQTPNAATPNSSSVLPADGPPAEATISRDETQSVRKEPDQAQGQSQNDFASNNYRSNVYIGNLPPTINESDLTMHFSEFGLIVRCKIGRHKHTGEPAGYGFVQFDTTKNAEKAIKAMNGTTLNGKVLRVSVANKPGIASKAHTNLYIAGLPLDITDERLDRLFTPFGKIVGSRLLVDAQGQNRGIGFVRYEKHDEAVRAINAMNGKALDAESDPITVKFAKERNSARENLSNGRGMGQHPRGQGSGMMSAGRYGHQPPPQGYAYPHRMPPSQYAFYDPYYYPPAHMVQPELRPKTNIYISGLPVGYDKDKLEDLFAPYGRIIGSRVLTHSNGESRGIGFVRFAENHEAAEAIRSMDGFVPPDATQQLVVKFARPSKAESMPPALPPPHVPQYMPEHAADGVQRAPAGPPGTGAQGPYGSSNGSPAAYAPPGRYMGPMHPGPSGMPAMNPYAMYMNNQPHSQSPVHPHVAQQHYAQHGMPMPNYYGAMPPSPQQGAVPSPNLPPTVSPLGPPARVHPHAHPHAYGPPHPRHMVRAPAQQYANAASPNGDSAEPSAHPVKPHPEQLAKPPKEDTVAPSDGIEGQVQ